MTETDSGQTRFRTVFGTQRTPGAPLLPCDHIKLQQEIESCASNANSHVGSIIVEGLDIQGTLSLSYILGRDVQLPTLTFIDCFIPELDLSFTHLTRLELSDCRLHKLSLLESQIDRGLLFQNLVFLPRPNSPEAIDEINLYGCRAGSRVTFDGVVCEQGWTKPINLESIDIDGPLHLFRCSFPSPINLDNASIGKEFQLSQSQATGGLTARNALTDAHFAVLDTTLGTRGSHAINAEGLEVGGAILIKHSRLEGTTCLIQCKVGVNIEFEHTRCDNGDDLAIELGGAQVRGDCFFRDDFVCVGGLALRTAEIGGVLYVENAVLSRSKDGPKAFHTDKLITKGRCYFNNVRMDGIISLNGAKIGGNAAFANITFAPPGRALAISHQPGAQGIDLSNAIITDELTFYELKNEEGGFFVLLRNASASIKNDAYGDAYKGAATFIDLTHFSTRNVYIPNKVALTKEIAFLRHNSELMFNTRRELHSQPFAHLASHLREAGWPEAADRVLWEMRRVQRRALRGRLGRAASWLFDLLFGYGYSKTRAILTLVLWVSVGVFGTNVALERQILIIDAPPVSSSVPRSSSGKPGQPTLTLLPADTAAGNIPCGDAIEPLFYAIELVLPVFDLGQKRQCNVRGKIDTDANTWPLREYVWWWIGKYVYTIGGWVIISLTALTILGSFKGRERS